MSTLTILEIVGILLIVAWNAFFVSAEYAFVAVRRTRIDELVEEGSGAAKRVRHLIDDPARFISAFQVAITLSSLALGAVGEPAVSAAFERVLGNLGALGEGAVAVISVILAFALITALHVVLGEIVPKTLTLSRAESVALGVALPVSVFMWLFWPFIWVLRGLSEALIRLLGLESPSEMRLVHSEEELKMLISASHEEGVLEESEEQLLHKVFDFAETEVKQVMVPRPDVIGMPVDLTAAEAIDRALASPYTRYPVYRESMDDLRVHEVDLLTLGQYLQPTVNHLPVARFVAPEEFDRYREWALARGFRECVSGPLVRSSYRAEQALAGNNAGVVNAGSAPTRP